MGNIENILSEKEKRMIRKAGLKTTNFEKALDYVLKTMDNDIRKETGNRYRLGVIRKGTILINEDTIRF